MASTQIRTGCISWTYPDWLGTFYPEGSKPADFLSLYSKVFDIVEIDSSFYRIPNPTTVKQWNERTPAGFLFTAKLPKKMTHEAKLRDISSSLNYFQKVIKALGPKLACVIAQMPPSFKSDKDMESLSHFLNEIDPEIRYAIEFRHASWIKKETYELLKSKNVSLVWSINEYVESIPPEVTSDFLYLRFMGEYSEFTKFDHAQSNKSDVLEGWWKNLEAQLPKVENAFVLASNHFEGFAPTTVNEFRSIAGLGETEWKERMTASKNATLF
jgi:uncharacterized protein YecE (DUF72 family)